MEIFIPGKTVFILRWVQVASVVPGKCRLGNQSITVCIFHRLCTMYTSFVTTTQWLYQHSILLGLFHCWLVTLCLVMGRMRHAHKHTQNFVLYHIHTYNYISCCAGVFSLVLIEGCSNVWHPNSYECLICGWHFGFLTALDANCSKGIVAVLHFVVPLYACRTTCQISRIYESTMLFW